MVSTPQKRLWLRRQYALVPGTHATLLLALRAAAFTLADLNAAGSVSSTSAGDRSTSFSNSIHGATPQDMAELGGDMLDLYDIAETALIAGGIPAPNDAQRFTEMLDRLVAITEVRTTYTNLRT